MIRKNVPITITAGSGGIGSVDEAGRLIKGSLMQKPKREYFFTIFVNSNVVGKTEWSTFRDIRKGMQPFESDRTVECPPDSLSGMKNYTTNETNARKRAAGMAEYIQSIMVLTDAIGKSDFYDALRLTDETKDRCVAACGEILAQRQIDCDLEQQKMVDQERSFALPTKWGYHQRPRDIMMNVNTTATDITESQDENSSGQQQQQQQQTPWYTMIRPYSLKDDKQLVHWQHLITNLAGIPVLGMKEGHSYDHTPFTNNTIGYDIYLFNSNSAANARRWEKVCHVSHNNTDGHFVEWSGSMMNQPPVICFGHHRKKPTYTLVNPKSRHVYATVNKTRRSIPRQPKPSSTLSSLFSSMASLKSHSSDNKHFQVTVSPGQNALLFLGIASAIDCNDRARDQQRKEEDMNRGAVG